METQVKTEPGRKIKGSHMQKITPFLWFNGQAEEAVNFYTSVFNNSKIKAVNRYGDEGAAVTGFPKGTVMTISFEIEGQEFVALNGGPHFTFTPAVSFVVNCETQDEIDYYWEKLSKGGDERAQQCGWLADRFGVSWQIVPTALGEMLSDAESGKSRRAMQAMLMMKKLDLNILKQAYEQG